MSSPTRRAGAPGQIVVGLLIAFCALLLLKWLAVVALAALVLAGLVWWARRDPTRARPSPLTVMAVPAAATGQAAAAPHAPAADDCSWCGRPGGHRDRAGRRVRPRHVHRVR